MHELGEAGGGGAFDVIGPLAALAYGASLVTYYLRSNPPKPAAAPAPVAEAVPAEVPVA